MSLNSSSSVCLHRPAPARFCQYQDSATITSQQDHKAIKAPQHHNNNTEASRKSDSIATDNYFITNNDNNKIKSLLWCFPFISKGLLCPVYAKSRLMKHLKYQVFLQSKKHNSSSLRDSGRRTLVFPARPEKELLKFFFFYATPITYLASQNSYV